MPTGAPLDNAAGQASTKRRKVRLACEACRARKARCNGAKPRCGNCSQRLERCVYRLSNSQLAETNQYIDSLVNRVSELESEIQQTRNAPRATSILQSHGRNASEPSSSAQASTVENHGGQPESHEVLSFIPADAQQDLSPQSAARLIVNVSSPVDGMGGNADAGDPSNTGEKFYGSSSATSFMKQFYSVISPESDATSSQRAKASGSKTMMRPYQWQNASSPGLCFGGPASFSLMPRVLTDYLLDLYWNRVYHLYPFLHRSTFMAAYEQLWVSASEGNIPRQPLLGLGGSEQSGPASSVFHCALNAILVLGVQFSDFSVAERNNLTGTLIQRARSQFKLDMFDDGSVEVVQTLLLLVQVFQFTTYPTRCWSAMGAACRLAQGLGLHLPDSRLQNQLQPVEVELRRRLWHGCMMLDLVVSMTLGRPTMLHHDSEVPLPRAIEDDHLELNQTQPPDKFSDMAFFVEAIKLYKTLSRILSQVYGENENQKPDVPGGYGSFDRLIGLDAELTKFAEQVPEPLQWTNKVATAYCSPLTAQQRHVLHARYLHLRVLLYRPTFTQFCRIHSSSPPTTSSNRDMSTASLALSPAASFAHCSSIACVRSAIDLIELTNQHAATNATGAWWYNMFYTRTAAMVVLLAHICPLVRESIGRSVLHSAWEHCRSILLHKLPQETTVRSCLQTLETLHEHVLNFGQRRDRRNVGESSRGTPEYFEAVDAEATTNSANVNTEFGQLDDYLGCIFDDSAFNFAIDEYGISLL